jgi:hypothetical protein
VALVWNFAIHGTVLAARNLKMSADVMGTASETLERTLGVPALFVNGAVGDVSPARHGEGALGETAAALAGAARAAWDRAAPVGPGPLRARAATVELGVPRLSLRNCLGAWVPAGFTLPLGDAFPAATTLTAVALGDFVSVALPGEPVTALGLQIKAESRRVFRQALVAGVSNDYVGYLVTPADWGRRGYVTCSSLYGADAGDRVAARAIALVRELGTAR